MTGIMKLESFNSFNGREALNELGLNDDMSLEGSLRQQAKEVQDILDASDSGLYRVTVVLESGEEMIQVESYSIKNNVEKCSRCGRSVSMGSGYFVNRTPHADGFWDRFTRGEPYPEGAFHCAECEEEILVKGHPSEAHKNFIVDFSSKIVKARDEDEARHMGIVAIAERDIHVDQVLEMVENKKEVS